MSCCNLHGAEFSGRCITVTILMKSIVLCCSKNSLDKSKISLTVQSCFLCAKSILFSSFVLFIKEAKKSLYASMGCFFLG